MFFTARLITRLRVPLLLVTSLFFGLATLAQITLNYRPLSGYMISPDASVGKENPTLMTFEEADEFYKVFRQDETGKKPGSVNFAKETAIGIVLPPTKTLPKVSVSRVFVQDSVLTVRFIRLKDTVAINNPQPVASQPMLLLAIPKQTVLKTRLIQNGKVIQTITQKKQ